jgi:hypothetical protein
LLPFAEWLQPSKVQRLPPPCILHKLCDAQPATRSVRRRHRRSETLSAASGGSSPVCLGHGLAVGELTHFDRSLVVVARSTPHARQSHQKTRRKTTDAHAANINAVRLHNDARGGRLGGAPVGVWVLRGQCMASQARARSACTPAQCTDTRPRAPHTARTWSPPPPWCTRGSCNARPRHAPCTNWRLTRRPWRIPRRCIAGRQDPHRVACT